MAVALSPVPDYRIRELNYSSIRPDGAYVLYWMIAARRPRWNYGLDRAVELCAQLGRPLVVLEPLRLDYPWSCDRFHRFAIDGMADNRDAFAEVGVSYYPYVEPHVGAGAGLLESLARDACCVVTDDFPAFFHPRMLAAAAQRLAVRLEAVDSNGILPLRATDRVYTRAFDFRRFLQRQLRPFLLDTPAERPAFSSATADATIPPAVRQRWPAASEGLLRGDPEPMSLMDIDHSVRPVGYGGGPVEGRRVLQRFVRERLGHYLHRNQVEPEYSSGLSPYLHFGHVSAHQILAAVASSEGWSTHDVARWFTGKRTGWWGMSPPAESFMDELITWRELGLNFCAHRSDYADYDSLPSWARETLAEHAEDPRPATYSLAEFEAAATHDELWNAAQNQLRTDGRIHNYLRMLWGKKILHWTESPEQAAEVMLTLNDKYAVDGRDPNSYSGIFWVLGRYDRAWGPEREVFGKIRYMTSANTRRKIKVGGYIERWGSGQVGLGL